MCSTCALSLYTLLLNVIICLPIYFYFNPQNQNPLFIPRGMRPNLLNPQIVVSSPPTTTHTFTKKKSQALILIRGVC